MSSIDMANDVIEQQVMKRFGQELMFKAVEPRIRPQSIGESLKKS